jgi:hypothetical protein
VDGPDSQLDLSGSVRFTDEAPNSTRGHERDRFAHAWHSCRTSGSSGARLSIFARPGATDPAIEGEIGVSNVDLVIKRPRSRSRIFRARRHAPESRVAQRRHASANGGELRAEGDFAAATAPGPK